MILHTDGIELYCVCNVLSPYYDIKNLAWEGVQHHGIQCTILALCECNVVSNLYIQ